ncbi:hypothetical protein V5E97_19970 [Singulisphaera sp. Ch08]|uniref:Uncharacterized protein n=1 Tax=Singulisphaera sp. Ch08 TaxID=3120278 RepID=A0AAU7CSX0_9BACT
MATADLSIPKFKVGIRMTPTNQERLAEDSPGSMNVPIVMDVDKQRSDSATRFGKTLHHGPIHSIFLRNGNVAERAFATLNEFDGHAS